VAKSGPIVIIEDDSDDREIVEEAIKELNISNEIHFFTTCSQAWTYLKTTVQKPFIILCDINLPLQNGLDFKRQIDHDPQLRQKSIPFIFYSTADNKEIVTKAYTEMVVQGFFKKNDSMDEIKKTLEVINEYWKLCQHPNSE